MIATAIFERDQGSPDWMETLAGEFDRALTEAEKAKCLELARSRGKVIRFAEIDLGTPPDFSACLN